MDYGEIKELIEKYGLPLEIKKEWWFGDYYFRAEKENNDGTISGSIFRNGSFYEKKVFLNSETMQLCHPYDEDYDEVEEDILINPNGLDTNKGNYKKGTTKLFISKDRNITLAYFDRFDKKNGADVIYVICEGESSARFYPFPQSTYLYPNKDDAQSAIDESNRSFEVRASSNSMVRAFQALPVAKKPSKSLDEEMDSEKAYHYSVDEKLKATLREPQAQLSKGQEDLEVINNNFRKEAILAREGGYRLDDHTYINRNMSTNKARRKIYDSEDEISKIENIRREPYFARIDCGSNVRDLHTAYIGDQEIPGFVIDWRRSEVGNAYYNSSIYQNRDDIFLALKRIITIKRGIFDGFDDEINLYYGDDYKEEEINYAVSTDDLLTKLLTESRLDKSTHDIIKTIQSEQYDIITSDFSKNAVINGCAGSGKTMIMYHRLSYMAYNYESVLKRKFNPDFVYIVSPSSIFDSTNNELMKKLSIDKINQAPFAEHIENLISTYCIQKDIVSFQSLIALIKTQGDEEEKFFSNDSFNNFFEKLKEIDKDIKRDREYREWIIEIANYFLETYGFKKISFKKRPKSISEIFELLSTTDYYSNDCFKKKDKKTGSENKQFYSPKAIRSISYENVIHSLGTCEKGSKTYNQRLRRINKNIGILKACLSTKTKFNFQSDVSTDISDFWNLLDNATTYEKMLVLILVEKLLECSLASKLNDEDYVLKCLFVYKKYFNEVHSKDFNLYILRAMSEKFGEIIIDDALIFIDEFQNYSSFEISCFKGAFSLPVFNLFGDYDQRIEDKGMDLKSNISDLLNPNAYNINVNYRNARQITEYINTRVHKNMKSIGVEGEVSEERIMDCSFDIKNRTAIICKDIKLTMYFLKRYISPKLINNLSSSGELIEGKIALMTVSDCKGLEFDTVYVFDCGMSDNEKYVAYTRALDSLFVLSEDLEELKKSEEEEKRRKAKEARQLAKQKAAEAKRNAEFQRLVYVFSQLILKRQIEESRICEEGLSKEEEPYKESYMKGGTRESVDEFKKSITVKEKAMIGSKRKRKEVDDSKPVIIPIEDSSEERIAIREKQLEEEIKKLAQYHADLERRELAAMQAELTRKGKIYSLATKKLKSDNPSELREALVLLETIDDYNDSIELMAQIKIKLLSIKEKENLRRQQLIAQKLCQYCGGRFKGFFTKTCRDCGQKKDY